MDSIPHLRTDGALFRMLRRQAGYRRPYKPRRIHILIDTELDMAIEWWAARENISKSAIIRRVLRAALPKQPPDREDPIDTLCGMRSFAVPPARDDGFYESLQS